MSGRSGRSIGAAPEHYSYALYADPAVADAFDALRFGGPVGRLLAETQARVLTEFVGAGPHLTVLDVGTGTGRAALTLAATGARVTGVDASPEMLRVARTRAAERALDIVFAPADAHALPFEARSFDVAVSLRVLMHTPDWRTCLGELCRVARGRIVFDYPSLTSVAVLQACGRHAAAALGVRTEPYRVLSSRAIRRELGRRGFAVGHVHRQFVLPIALHKRIGSSRVTERIEHALALLGLLRLFGSPVTVMAERCGSS